MFELFKKSEEKTEEKKEKEIDEIERQIFPIRAHPVAIKSLLNVEDILTKLEAYLRGHKVVWDKEKNRYVMETNPQARPLMNEEGIQTILTILRMRLDPLLHLTIVDEEYILIQSASFEFNLIDILLRNAERWGIDQTLIWEIKDLIVTAYEELLRRNLGGATLRGVLSQPMPEIKYV